MRYHCVMEQTKRPPSDRDQGRKTKSPTGEVMKTRAMRWTDAGWADVLLIGMDRVRELVRKEADKVRKATPPTS